MIAAFDSKAMLAVKAKVNEELSTEDIVEVYDLRADPMQRKNLKRRFNFHDYKKYYEMIEKRLKEIEKANFYEGKNNKDNEGKNGY